MDDFQKMCLGLINRYAEEHLLDGSGRAVRPDSFDRLTDNARHLQRSTALAVAMLTHPAWQAAHPAADALRALAIRLTDAWADAMIAHCAKVGFPPNFEMICLTPTVELLADVAPAASLKRWRRAVADCARASERFLLAKQAAWGRPGPFTGCGPNHLFIVAAPLYRFGRLLGEPRYTGLARRALRRHCQVQVPEGYFPENSGPAVLYQRVSLFGLCDYHAASGDAFVEPYVQRGIQFAARAFYPDLSNIETIDQRNRSGCRVGQVAQNISVWDLAFGRSDVGRRLAHLMLARLADTLLRKPKAVTPTHVGMAAMAAVMSQAGRSAARLPCERASYVDRFDDKAAVVRRDGWCVVLSGYFQSDRPGNPFILDRTQNVSVFSDRAGLVIGGGNDKRRFDAATFELAESGYVHYFPPIGGRARAAGRQGVVELDYGAARARLAATIRSPQLVELVGGATTNFADQANRLNLQIPVGPGMTVRVDGRAVRLSRTDTRPRSWPVKRSLELPGNVRLEPAGGGEFCWPHLPHNCYAIGSYASTIEAATGYLRVPLSGRDLSERTVRIRL